MKTKTVETLSIPFIKCCDSIITVCQKRFYCYKCNVPPMAAMGLLIYIPSVKMTNTN